MTNVHITYLDTAMILVEIDSLRLLTDPVLDPAGTEVDDGPVRLVKTNSPPLTDEALGRIDAVLLSHDQHGDNLDAGGRALLARVPLVLTTPLGATRLGGTAQGLEPWSSRALQTPQGGAVTVTAVPAQHAPDTLLDIVGPVTGFIVESGTGGRPLYISGDTIRFAGTGEIARRFAPIGAAVLHLGRAQVEPLGPVNLSLSAEEAADYAQELGASAIVPIHYEGWKHFTESRDAAEAAFARAGLAERVRWLNPGERVELTL